MKIRTAIFYSFNALTLLGALAVHIIARAGLMGFWCALFHFFGFTLSAILAGVIRAKNNDDIIIICEERF